MSTTTGSTAHERLEQLQALGFDGEADYEAHQRLLARAAELGKSHTLLVADGPWCMVP